MTPERQERLLFISVVVGALFFRIVILQTINEGPDEIDYWFAATRLFSKLPYPVLTHRTVRWPIIIPVALLQLVTGTHPVMYYGWSLLLAPIQAALLYRIVRRHEDPVPSLLAVLILLFFPYLIRANSQIRPEPFVLVYLLAMWVSLDRFSQTDRRSSLFFAAVWLFIAYLTKITSIYFIPGVALFLIWQKRSEPKEALKDALFFGAVLLLLYAVEHLSYAVFAGQRWGRLGIIASFHLPGTVAKDTVPTFWALFRRYNNEQLPILWKLLLVSWPFALWYTWRTHHWLRGFLFLGGAFLLFITFMVSSIHPLVPVEPFNNRYFIPVLIAVIPVVSVAVYDLVPGRVRRFLEKRVLYVLPVLFVLALAGTLLPFPDSLRRYYTPLNDLDSHPLVDAVRITDVTRDAVEDGLVFITVDEESGYNNKGLDTINRIFADYVNGRELPEYERSYAILGGIRFDAIATGRLPVDEALSAPELEVVFVQRRPLRVSRIPIENLPHGELVLKAVWRK